MSSTKKHSIPLIVVCVLGLLQVPGALICQIINSVDDFKWLINDGGFSSIVYSLFNSLPFLLIIPAAAITFILLMIDKIPKARTVILTLCIPVYLLKAVAIIPTFVQYFSCYDTFDKLNISANILLCFLEAICFILAFLGCIKPKLSWMILAISLAAVLMSLKNIIYVIACLIQGYHLSIFTYLSYIFSFDHIFFFFGIAVFLYGRWKKKQAALSA